MPAKKQKSEEQGIPARTLLVQTKDGELKIDIPTGARITFGPTIPFTRKDRQYQSNEGYSLRIYATSKNESLIAVFAGVESFRDITIPVAKLIVREAGKSVWKSDETGYKVEQEVEYDKSFQSLNLLEGKKED